MKHLAQIFELRSVKKKNDIPTFGDLKVEDEYLIADSYKDEPDKIKITKIWESPFRGIEVYGSSHNGAYVTKEGDHITLIDKVYSMELTKADYWSIDDDSYKATTEEAWEEMLNFINANKGKFK